MPGREFEYRPAMLGDRVAMFLRMHLDAGALRRPQHFFGLPVGFRLQGINDDPLDQFVRFCHHAGRVDVPSDWIAAETWQQRLKRRQDGQADIRLPRPANDHIGPTGHELIADAGLRTGVTAVVTVYVNGFNLIGRHVNTNAHVASDDSVTGDAVSGARSASSKCDSRGRGRAGRANCTNRRVAARIAIDAQKLISNPNFVSPVARPTRSAICPNNSGAKPDGMLSMLVNAMLRRIFDFDEQQRM